MRREIGRNGQTPVRTEGDVDARVWIRIREIEQSLTLIARILDQLPDSAIRADVARQGVF
jgi:Ni,Fe-hydrogenase III large subunit